MSLAWHERHLHPGAHRRLRLMLAAIAAFLLALLWAKPIG